MRPRTPSPYLTAGGNGGAGLLRNGGSHRGGAAADDQAKDKRGGAGGGGARLSAQRRNQRLLLFAVLALAALAFFASHGGGSPLSFFSRGRSSSPSTPKTSARAHRRPIPESPEDVREGETPAQAAARRARGRAVDEQIAREVAAAEAAEARRRVAAARSARELAEEEKRMQAAARAHEEALAKEEAEAEAESGGGANAGNADAPLDETKRQAALEELAALVPKATRVSLPNVVGIYDMRRLIPLADRRRIEAANKLVRPEERIIFPKPGGGASGAAPGAAGGNGKPFVSLAERRRRAAEEEQAAKAKGDGGNTGNHDGGQLRLLRAADGAPAATHALVGGGNGNGNGHNAQHANHAPFQPRLKPKTPTTASFANLTAVARAVQAAVQARKRASRPKPFHLHTHWHDQPLLVARPNALPEKTFNKLRRDLLTSPLLYRRNELDPDSFGKTTGFVLFFTAGRGEKIVRDCPLFNFLVPFFDRVRLPEATAFVANVLRSEPVTGEKAEGIERAEAAYQALAAAALGGAKDEEDLGSHHDAEHPHEGPIALKKAAAAAAAAKDGAKNSTSTQAIATDAAADEGLVTAGAHIDNTLEQFAPEHWDTESHQTSVLYVRVPKDMRGGRLELWKPNLGNATHPRESGIGPTKEQLQKIYARWEAEEAEAQRLERAAAEAKKTGGAAVAGGGGAGGGAAEAVAPPPPPAGAVRAQADAAKEAEEEGEAPGGEEEEGEEEGGAEEQPESEDDSLGPPTRVVRPQEGTIISFRGDSMHRVLKHTSPELGHVRISLVIEQYLVPKGEKLKELEEQVGAPVWISGQDERGRAENAVLAPWRGMWDPRWGEHKAAWLMAEDDEEEEQGSGGVGGGKGPEDEPVDLEEAEVEAYKRDHAAGLV